MSRNAFVIIYSILTAALCIAILFAGAAAIRDGVLR